MHILAKKELFEKKIASKILKSFNGIPIDRENPGINSIIQVTRALKNGCKVGIFPEGYIHQKRKLQHFRPGVFKIAQKANVPIVVCTVRDTHHVVKNLLKCKTSDSHMHVLVVIPVEELAGKTTVEIAQRAYDLMAADLGPENVLTEVEENT